MTMRYSRFVLKALFILCILQVIFSLYLVIKIYASSIVRPDQNKDSYIDNNGEPVEIIDFTLKPGLSSEESLHLARESKKLITVLGKAAISTYFWEHILQGRRTVQKSVPGIIAGKLLLKNMVANYLEGPGLDPSSFPQTMEKIIFIGNGRTEESILVTKEWLDYFKRWLEPPKVVLILLGNEKCENNWLGEYLSPEGPVRGVYLTYDDPSIDNIKIFQWPLGVATYRNFPNLREEQLEVSSKRKYICNIQATNYPNSTRSELFDLLKKFHFSRKRCFVKERNSWQATESPESMNDYIWYLIHSDLTLCPAGFNPETYRVYEALAAGSVPVIEDVVSEFHCDKESWRLLKEYRSPVIWVKNWKNELPGILKREKRISLSEKIKRREEIIRWYSWFKLEMRKNFLSFIDEHLLQPG